MHPKEGPEGPSFCAGKTVKDPNLVERFFENVKVVSETLCNMHINIYEK